MKKPDLFITQPVFPEHETLLQEHFRVTINRNDSEVLRSEAIAAGLGDSAYLFCRLGDPVTREVIMGAPNLACIATMATRPTHIDLNAAQEKGVAVLARQNELNGETVGDNTPDTADLAFGLLLALARNIVTADREMRQGRFPGPQSHKFTGLALEGATLGLIGMGPVARHMIKRAIGFSMRVIYWSRTRKIDVEQEYEVVYRDLPELLREADCVSLHIPGNTETYGFMNAEKFALMRPTALLLNTARGEVVDPKALYQALRDERIAGAALDVFADEPWPKLPQSLVDSPRLVVTPHLGSAVTSKRRIMERIVCENLITFASERKHMARHGKSK